MKRPIAFVAVMALFASCTAPGQVSREDDEGWQRHVDKVRELLTPHSALPSVLDMTQPGSIEASQATAAGRSWERKFTGTMLNPEITDPGTSPEIGPGSISTTSIEYGGKRWAIPAASCEAVLRVRPVASNVHFAWTRRFVYSTFTLDILETFKGWKSQNIENGRRIRAAQFGGTIRFPSGHVETFITVGEGFMTVGNEYFVFIGRPLRSDDTWVTTQPYVIEKGLVFPLRTEGVTESELAVREKGIPEKEFETKIRAAIARNVDANY